jgi:hypothetical protein
VSLPEGFEYGDVRGGLGRWCIHRTGDRLMLCGQEIHHVPAPEFQPTPDEEGFAVHGDCAERMEWLLVSGICRVCGFRKAVTDGLVEPHGCGGDGLPPKRVFSHLVGGWIVADREGADELSVLVAVAVPDDVAELGQFVHRGAHGIPSLGVTVLEAA